VIDDGRSTCDDIHAIKASEDVGGGASLIFWKRTVYAHGEIVGCVERWQKNESTRLKKWECESHEGYAIANRKVIPC
jgi:hypothetical protein